MHICYDFHPCSTMQNSDACRKARVLWRWKREWLIYHQCTRLLIMQMDTTQVGYSLAEPAASGHSVLSTSVNTYHLLVFSFQPKVLFSLQQKHYINRFHFGKHIIFRNTVWKTKLKERYLLTILLCRRNNGLILGFDNFKKREKRKGNVTECKLCPYRESSSLVLFWYTANILQRGIQHLGNGRARLLHKTSY